MKTKPKLSTLSDGTITVSDTLVMSPVDYGRMTWDDALKFVSELEAHGHKDWRLPTKEEGHLLAKLCATHPEHFNGNQYCWLREQYVDGTAWYEDLRRGEQVIDFRYGKNAVVPVRSVSGIQSFNDLKTLSYEDWKKLIADAHDEAVAAYLQDALHENALEKYEAAKWVDSREFLPENSDHHVLIKIRTKSDKFSYGVWDPGYYEVSEDYWKRILLWTYIILPAQETPEQREQRAIEAACKYYAENHWLKGGGGTGCYKTAVKNKAAKAMQEAKDLYRSIMEGE